MADSSRPLPSSTSGKAASSTTVSARTVPSAGNESWPAARSRRNSSRDAIAVMIAIASARTAPPSASTTSRTGTRIAALIARSRITSLRTARSATVSSLASRELQECRVECLGPEIGPERLAPVELGVGGLPDQEVRQALFPAGADDEVRIGHAGGVQRVVDRRLVDRLRIDVR